MKKKLYAKDITKTGSSGYNPKEWEEIPEIKVARPTGKGYVEISLQRLDTPKSVILVQWNGAKNGFWYPEGPIFIITKTK